MNTMFSRYILALLSFFCTNVFLAQKKDSHFPKGYDQYNEKQYADAEANFRISKSDTKNPLASYNLGNAIYRQNQAAEAKYAFADAIDKTKSKTEKHKIFHNLGNVFMVEKNYSKAVDAYKDALRNNPNDEQTRYNFALAKQKLKENPPKDDKKDGENKQNKDKNKDQQKDKSKEKDKDNKDKNNPDNKDNKDNKDKKDSPDNKDNKDDKDQKNPNNPKDGDGKPKPNPSGLSKERLENLLNAVNNEEKNIQEKVKAKQAIKKPVKPEKDW